MGTFRTVSAVALALALALGSGLAAQDPVAPVADSRQVPAFRSATQLVALNVTVMDGQKLVTGLEQEQFEVYEDGVRQQVRFFEASSVPLDLILLLDASSSMRARMPVVHDAAKSFMTILRPGDRGAVVAFNQHVEIVQDLTGDHARIEKAIETVEGRGSTALHNAVYVALKAFGRGALAGGDIRRQAIAVLSDGEDTSSLVTFEDVVDLARARGVNVYTIGLQSRATTATLGRVAPSVSASSYMLTQLARETGARAFFPAGAHQLKDVYTGIADELNAQYAIAYAPANGDADGRFRRIMVRIPANPEFRPRTRAGYTADPSRATAELLGGLR